jgi:hypothetical protein
MKKVQTKNSANSTKSPDKKLTTLIQRNPPNAYRMRRRTLYERELKSIRPAYVLGADPSFNIPEDDTSIGKSLLEKSLKRRVYLTLAESEALDRIRSMKNNVGQSSREEATEENDEGEKKVKNRSGDHEVSVVEDMVGEGGGNDGEQNLEDYSLGYDIFDLEVSQDEDSEDSEGYNDELAALKDSDGRLDSSRFEWDPVLFSGGRRVLRDKLTGKTYKKQYF